MLWRQAVVLGMVCIILRTGAQANQPPTFTQGMDYEQIPEDTPVGSTVYTLSATDADGDTLTYGVSGQVSNNLFIVDPSSGVVTLKTPLDRESDVSQTSIFRVTASDADQGIGGTVSYFLEAGDESKFEVDRPTGVVNLKEELDYEESSVYQLRIRAQEFLQEFLQEAFFLQEFLQEAFFLQECCRHSCRNSCRRKEICGNCAHLAHSSATLGRPRPGSRCMTSWLGSCDWLTRPGSSEMAGNPAAMMVIRDAPPDSGNNGPGGSEQ
uniref:Cadherin domain-containing protein n=1 Tax=Branchiostoma floridae TaxID=7739 RepID=C3XYW5_BRAFL|eukprot:XP_002610990.1 hypothetical protein BRAFLDRAFT_130872 [Branchiostoma floridae]